MGQAGMWGLWRSGWLLGVENSTLCLICFSTNARHSNALNRWTGVDMLCLTVPKKTQTGAKLHSDSQPVLGLN